MNFAAFRALSRTTCDWWDVTSISGRCGGTRNGRCEMSWSATLTWSTARTGRTAWSRLARNSDRASRRGRRTENGNEASSAALPPSLLAYTYPMDLYALMASDWPHFGEPLLGRNRQDWATNFKVLAKVRTPLAHNREGGGHRSGSVAGGGDLSRDTGTVRDLEIGPCFGRMSHRRNQEPDVRSDAPIVIALSVLIPGGLLGTGHVFQFRTAATMPPASVRRPPWSA